MRLSITAAALRIMTFSKQGILFINMLNVVMPSVMAPMIVTKTPAYYDTEIITALISFIVQVH
jgi:hypothetical protein